MKTWEGSKADEAQDKMYAKQMGISVSQYEGSALDNKRDAAAQRKLNKDKNSSSRAKRAFHGSHVTHS